MAVRRVPAGALIASALGTIAHSPATAETLSPLKPWVLDYADTQCVAQRQYGDAADPLTLAILSAPNGETYELIIARKHSGPGFAQELPGTVDFGHGPIKAWLLHYGAMTDKIEFYTFRISASDMAQARTASAVTLRSGVRPNVTFSLANMTNLLKGLEACTADLKTYWNMNGKEVGTIAVPSRGDVRRIFSDLDYPSEAMDRRQEGTAQFLVLIDQQGKVAGCHVLKASGSPALDGRGCQVIRERAKFKPARDKAGKPVRSTYITPPVTWRMY